MVTSLFHRAETGQRPPHSAQSALVEHTTTTTLATPSTLLAPTYRLDAPVTTKDCSIPKDEKFVSASKHKDARTTPLVTPQLTNVLPVVPSLMELRNALEYIRHNARTPFSPDTWQFYLEKFHLSSRYPNLVSLLKRG